MSWMLLLATEALAGPADVIANEGVTVVVRGLGESWDDASLGGLYRPSAFLGGVGLVVPVHPLLSVDIEVASGRYVGPCEGEDCEGYKLSVRPVSVVFEGNVPMDKGVFFAGVGPSLATFSEVADVTTVGSKGSLDFRVGIRWDMDLQLDNVSTQFELYGGRRVQRWGPEVNPGFDLAAWRGSAGVGFVF